MSISGMLETSRSRYLAQKSERRTYLMRHINSKRSTSLGSNFSDFLTHVIYNSNARPTSFCFAICRTLQIEKRRTTLKRCLMRAEPLHDRAWSNEGVHSRTQWRFSTRTGITISPIEPNYATRQCCSGETRPMYHAVAIPREFLRQWHQQEHPKQLPRSPRSLPLAR